MEPCHQCGGVFCTEAVDDMECASLCTCEKVGLVFFLKWYDRLGLGAWWVEVGIVCCRNRFFALRACCEKKGGALFVTTY